MTSNEKDISNFVATNLENDLERTPGRESNLWSQNVN